MAIKTIEHIYIIDLMMTQTKLELIEFWGNNDGQKTNRYFGQKSLAKIVETPQWVCKIFATKNSGLD